MQLILASSSPRRKELLEKVGFIPVVVPSRVDETAITAPTPDQLTEALAEAKARDVFSRIDWSGQQNPEGLILAADTVVVLHQQVLGKPRDAGEAKQMLMQLQGQTHQVITGVALLVVEAGELIRSLLWSETTDVTFRRLTEDEIDAYIRTGEPMDKAGAYGIQGRAAAFVSSVRGCYSNVVGLPLAALCEQLNKLGLHCYKAW